MENTNKVQCYYIDEEKLYICQLPKSKVDKDGRYQSPLDAINRNIELQNRILRNEEYKVKRRKEIIDDLKNLKDKYISGNMFDDVEDNQIDIYSRFWK